MCDCPERFPILCSFTSVSLSGLLMWSVPGGDCVYYYLFCFSRQGLLKVPLAPSRNFVYCVLCLPLCPLLLNPSPRFTTAESLSRQPISSDGGASFSLTECALGPCSHGTMCGFTLWFIDLSLERVLHGAHLCMADSGTKWRMAVQHLLLLCLYLR